MVIVNVLYLCRPEFFRLGNSGVIKKCLIAVGASAAGVMTIPADVKPGVLTTLFPAPARPLDLERLVAGVAAAISGMPTTNVVEIPPSAAASASDQAFEIEWSRRSGKSVVRTPGFTSAGIVITPAANAPTATKLTWPKEMTPELPTKT